MSNITLVTGLWDIGRGNLSEGWSRGFDYYLNKFEQLLTIDTNMIIYGDENLRKFVFEIRNESNTQFILRNIDWFINNEFYEDIQKIRQNPEWLSLSGWLKDSTQARLELYNPLVMSKMFLLHDAKVFDKFDSKFLFWIDAGITNTVHPGYFTHDKVLEKLEKNISKFTFVCFPYEANTEIHGFETNKINEFAGAKINKVARGGFFGGKKTQIPEINSIYYSILRQTLSEGYMGTEESIFSIMCYKYAEHINYFLIEPNGLLSKFFEDTKNENLQVRSEIGATFKPNLDVNKVGLYVITFNSPTQFKTLIDSILDYDEEFIFKTNKFLLDNSSDDSTFEEYRDLCQEFGFEHIKKDNLGICGGRQFIAEHFNESDLDFYLFFEDDMFFFPHEGVCRNGFNRYVKNLYTTTLNIMVKEQFDFIKFNFSEFFGDNGTQWSWYNVPQSVREQFWPEYPERKGGIDPNAPKTIFKNIKSINGVPYASGEIYYSNWPQIVSRTGNKKMFLDTTWAHPYEQTWMSHMFQLTKKGDLNPGILLLTPTEHNRFDHYDGKLRKES